MSASRWWLSFGLVLLALTHLTQLAWGVLADSNIQFPDLYEASILELQAGLDAGHFTSVDLVKVSVLYSYTGIFVDKYLGILCTH